MSDGGVAGTADDRASIRENCDFGVFAGVVEWGEGEFEEEAVEIENSGVSKFLGEFFEGEGDGFGGCDLDGISAAEDGGGGVSISVEPGSFVVFAGGAVCGGEEWGEVDLSMCSVPDIEDVEGWLDLAGVCGEDFECESGLE